MKNKFKIEFSHIGKNLQTRRFKDGGIARMFFGELIQISHIGTASLYENIDGFWFLVNSYIAKEKK